MRVVKTKVITGPLAAAWQDVEMAGKPGGRAEPDFALGQAPVLLVSGQGGLRRSLSRWAFIGLLFHAWRGTGVRKEHEDAVGTWTQTRNRTEPATELG